MKQIVTVFVGIIILLVGMCFEYVEDWYVFDSKEFSIEFPKKPTASIQTFNSAVGELKMDMLMYDGSKDNDDNFLYGLITSEYPDSLINSGKTEILSTFFRNSIDGTVKNVQGKLLSEKSIEINGFHGREVKVDFQNGLAIIKMRMYLVQNKMIILQTITETSRDNNPPVSKFHDTFKLKKISVAGNH